MQNSKKNKIGMLQNAVSRTLETGLNSVGHPKRTAEVLDKLEGVEQSDLTEDTQQLIRDIKSIQSHNEALLDRASQFLNQFEEK